MNQHSELSRRVLIASANPLFREGLYKLYAETWSAQKIDVGVAVTMKDTLKYIESDKPDLVIVDHDDRAINRIEFLSQFVTSESPMKVILFSLSYSEPIVIYHRIRMTAAQAEAWLANPWGE